MYRMPRQQRSGGRLIIKPFYWLVGVLFGLVLVGCTAEMDVTVLPDEQWEGMISIELPAEMVESMGGIEELRSQMESESDMPSEDFNPEDFRIEETSDGGARMIGETSGQGFEDMNEGFFDGTATISTNDQGHVTISNTYEDMDELGMGITMNVRISGGEIIDSNADRVEGSTAIWENPSSVEVTLVPGRPTGGVSGIAAGGGSGTMFLIIAAVIAIIVVLGIVGVVVFFVMKGKKQPPQPPQQPPQPPQQPPQPPAETTS
jgi:hypothetical protein